MRKTRSPAPVISKRLAAVAVIAAFLAAACSSADDSETAPVADDTGDPEKVIEQVVDEGGGSYEAVIQDGRVVFENTAAVTFDAKVIKDGSVDIRIEPGAFGTTTAQVRAIALDLDGYVASGESRIEEHDSDRYAVGWLTIKVPTDRFDEAVSRVEQLGERVASQLSSQDVTEEYVDLEGRLGYWREQEAFYQRLMAEATTIEELVTIQTRMQDVLLNIEQLEGRLRCLDSRTAFATLTVGVSEVPGGPITPTEPPEPNPIAAAFDQAGEVLLATVSFIIVGTAVLIPIGILVGLAYISIRLFQRAGRRDAAQE